jgi:protein-disulfide isomerase
MKEALNDWYNQKYTDYKSWANEYPTEDGKYYEALKEQRDWCSLTNITGTPTIFINGRRLPQNYQPEDIKYFI